MARTGHLHIGFLAAIGVLGWAAVVVTTLVPLEPLRGWSFTWEVAACFFMAAAARLLAVRVYQKVRIALDSAFYISAAFVFGCVPAAWMVLLVFTAEAMVRQVHGTGLVARDAPSHQVAAYIASNGGLPALVLLSVGLAFGIDALHPLPDLQLTWLEPTFAVFFLLIHYFLAGGSHWLAGTPSSLWREFFLRVVLAELFLVPLALAMVLGYQHQGIGLYLLLGATCLVFNIIFRRATVASEKLRERVEELSTLDKVGRIISGSLERRTLLSNIATEALRLVRHTSRFMIGTAQPGEALVTYELFDESGKSYRQINAPRDEGLSGWVMQHREPLLLGDVRRQYALYSKTETYNDPRFQSWLGVPLCIYDEVMGVMSVQSEQRDAYTVNHLRVLTTIADQAAVALENSRLYELATVDGLTGLLVRRHFDQRLDEEWRRSQRYANEFTVGIIDLDNFKMLNDTYGHQTGDQVLRAAAAVVRRNMRGADLAGRYGGEEFAFILPRTRLSEGLTVAERIRGDMEKLELSAAGKSLKISASIGLAAYPESSVAHVAELVARADEALYSAKRQGKNRVCTSATEPGKSPPAQLPREQGAL